MTDVGVGLTGFIGFGKETTFGTPVARTNFIELNDEDMAYEEGKIESAALARVGILNTHVVQGMKSVSGSFGFDARYAGWERMLTQLMGSIETLQPDITSNPTVHDHTFKIADELPTGMTVEVFRGTENFTTEPNKSFIFEGCVLTSGTFSCGVDDLLKVSFEMIGEDENRGDKSTPTYDNSPLAVFHEGVVEWNNNDVCANNFALTINNQLEGRPKLGSRLTRAPKRSGKLEVTGSFQAEFVSWDEYDDFRNNTDRKLTVTFTSGTVISGSFVYTITFTINVAKILSHRVRLDTPGRLMLDIDFKAYRQASGVNEVEIVMRNDLPPDQTH